MFNKNDYLKRAEEIWESDLTILKSIIVRIPIEIEGTFRELHKRYPHIEVGAYLKYAPKTEGETLVLEVEKEIYIPKQECTSGDIKFLEPPPEGWNAVIHKHPSGVSRFSSTDETYINANFDLSILFEPQTGFCDASYRLKTDYGLLKMKPKIEVIQPKLDIEKLPLENIQEKRYTPLTTYRGYGYGYGYRGYYDYYDYGYGYGYGYTKEEEELEYGATELETAFIDYVIEELEKRGFQIERKGKKKFKGTAKFKDIGKIKVEGKTKNGYDFVGKVKITQTGEVWEFEDELDMLNFIDTLLSSSP